VAVEFGYKCVEIFSVSNQFKDVNERFNLDRQVIVEVAKAFLLRILLYLKKDLFL
jgi:hypothetical protein